MKLHRGTHKHDKIKITDALSVNNTLLLFLKKHVKNNKELFWLSEMIEEPVMTFFETEITRLSENLISVKRTTTDPYLIGDINEIISFLENAFDSEEAVFIWKD